MIEEPKLWSAEQFEAERQKAIAIFRHERLEEPVELYTSALDEQQGIVEELLEQTVDLQEMGDQELIEILGKKKYRDAFRYLAGPPISDDDWKTLADTTSFSKKRMQEEPGLVHRLAQVVLSAIDRRRFPWLAEQREPTEQEREAATLASACLWAYQRTQTDRRSSGKKRLEESAESCLLEAGFRQVATREIALLKDAPLAGEFCRESIVAGRKVDLVAGLWDGRHALIECKDSNSYLNSLKRLNNDAAAKALHWISEYGRRPVVPIAVISGVFQLDKLQAAQQTGLFIFWGHGMDEFCSWLQRVRDSSKP